jgi:hypothetical protein
MKSFSAVLLRSMIALAVCAVAFVAKAEIDLTPSVTEYTAEGVKFRQLIFRDNKERIEYELPTGWSFDGSSSALRLKPPQGTFAEAVVQAAALSKAQPLDENARASLKQKVVADLPAGSQLAKIEQETESPLLLGGQPTFELIVSYQLMGEKFCRSILFGNRSNVQWSFRLTAKKTDFGQLQAEFRRSILSWHWFSDTDKAAESSKPTTIATAP